MLSTRQIELFCALYEEKSVVKAANAVGMSQPNASRLLKDMRNGLDDALFISVHNALEPTEYSDSMYPHMREVIDKLIEIESIRKNTEVVYQKLNVKMAASDYFLHVVCPRLIDSVSEYIDDMFIHMMPMLYDQNDVENRANELKRGRVDFVVHESAGLSETLTKKAILTDDWVLISPLGIDKSEISYIKNGRALVDSYFNEQDTCGSCSEFQTIIELVKAGVGYGAVPSRLVLGMSEFDVSKLDISAFKLYLYWRPDRSKDQRLHFLRKSIVKECSSLPIAKR